MLSLLLLFAINLEQLQSNAGVASAKELLPGTESRIIHIRDWHLVPRDDFAVDTGLKGKELDKAYDEHLEAVELVQKSQFKIQAGVKEVYGEGLTEEDYPIFRAEVRALRPFHRDLPSSIQPTATTRN